MILSLFTLLAATSPAVSAETCISSGKEIELAKDISDNASFQIAKDGKIGVLTDGNKRTVFYFPSLRRQEIKNQKGIFQVLDGERVSFTNSPPASHSQAGSTIDERKLKLEILDLNTGKVERATGKFVTFSDTGSLKLIEVRSSNKLTETLTRLSKKIPKGETVSQAWGQRSDFQFSGMPAVFFKNGEVRILPQNAEDFREVKVDVPAGKTFAVGAISSDGKTIAGSICNRDKCEQLVTIDAETGIIDRMDIPASEQWPSYSTRGTFTREGSFIPVTSRSIIDFKNKRIIPMKGYPESGYGHLYSGKYCAFQPDSPAESAANRTCFDTKTGGVVSMHGYIQYPSPLNQYGIYSYLPDGSLISREGNRLVLIPGTRMCTNSATKALNPECEGLTPETVPTEFFTSLGAALRCETEYQPVGFPQDLNEEQLSEVEAVRWLEKFSKPGAFSSANDLRAMQTIVNRGWEKKYANETKNALAGILATSPNLYVQLLNNLPALANVKGKITFSCLTPAEKEKVTNSALAYLGKMQKGSSRPVIELAKSTGRLAIGILDEDARYKMADDIATAGLEQATRFGRQLPIFPYKLHVMLNSIARETLGLPAESVTDLSLIKKDGEIRPVLVASKAEGELKVDSQLGIAMRALPPIKVAELPRGATESEVHWEFNGKKYESKVKLTRPIEERQVISEAKAPDYQSMWKDGELRGLVVVGSNMESDLTDKTVQAYLSYYMKNGFKFDKPTEVNDLKSLMKDRISSDKGGADYFIKEAHSDGDQQNLFEIPKTARMVKGERSVNGKKEVLEILFPSGENASSEKLSNADFGDWVKAREKSGGGQFLYLNSSCWSAQKAPFEVAAAYSPTLLNIASTGMVDTFENKPTNVMRIMVDAIRKSQNYDQMRKNLEKDPEYKAKTANTFVFPDSDEYRTHITQKMDLPVTIDAQLYRVENDGARVPYSAEQ